VHYLACQTDETTNNWKWSTISIIVLCLWQWCRRTMGELTLDELYIYIWRKKCLLCAAS
jgi:hypothetical protein